MSTLSLARVLSRCVMLAGALVLVGLGLHVSPAYAQGGLPLWTSRFDAAMGVSAHRPRMALDRTGNVFVTGSPLDGNGSEDFLTLAYSNAGIPLWTNYYDGPSNGRDIPHAMIVTSAGNVVVSGRSWSGYDYTSADFLTVAYSNTGIPLWTNRYDGPGYGLDWPHGIAADDHGNVFVAGESWSGSDFDSTDFVTIAYSNEGLPLWTNLYDGPESGSDSALSITVNSAGNVFATGSSRGASGYSDCTTVAYSNSGVPLWTNRYNGSQNDSSSGNAIAADVNGNVFVTGFSGGGYGTVGYSGTGIPLWANIYRGPTDTWNSPNAIAVDPNGNVFVTGESRKGTDTTVGADYVTVAYSGAGVPLWTNRYNGPGNNSDVAEAIAVDDAGNVFVTGHSWRTSSDTSEDYATIAYSGAGVPLWTNRYNGPSNRADAAFGIAVDSTGNVFVAGWSGGSSGNAYYVTIKYSSSVRAYLSIQKFEQHAVLSWTNAGYSLQSAPTLTSTFTNIPGATSPYTNPIANPQQFFRLKSP